MNYKSANYFDSPNNIWGSFDKQSFMLDIETD